MASSSSLPTVGINNEPEHSTGGTAKRKMETGKELEELRRVQVANEGMRLLLNSRLREAEELFKASK